MMSSDRSAEKVIREILSNAGIQVNGKEPGDIVVHRPEFYARFLRDASIGLGESYMEGWWDTDAFEVFAEKLFRANLQKTMQGDWKMRLLTVRALLLNLQNRKRAYEVGEAHYDIGNDLYEIMLDKRMIYTCAYWKDAKDLDAAQEAKLELVCRKAGLRPGMKVLDLGCGWGGFANYAAEKHGVEVTGVSISKEQVALGRKRAGKLPVNIHLMDYRSVRGSYDAVVSIGMMEHVGYKNYRSLMEVVHRCLKDEGISVIHTVGSNHSQIHGIPFVEKYLFPNSAAPSIAQLGKAMEGLFVLEDVHNIGPDYFPTLIAWWENFKRRYNELDQKKYDQRFYRMWQFYLLGAAGSIKSRDSQLYQLVMTKMGRAQPDCRKS
jgi:cyclopropane-fatty-acyl-phospholipid synthase